MTRLLLVLSALSITVSFAAAEDVKRSDLKPGLLLTGTDAGGFAVTRLEPTVGMTLLPGQAAHPQSDGGKAFTWSGYIQIITPGKYQFEATTLGKLTVSIGGQEVLSGTVDGEAAKRLPANEVELQQGIQAFEAKLERIGKGTRVELLWTGPGFRSEPIPNFFFGHTFKQRPAAFAADLQKEHGRFLFEELACVKCHTAGPTDKLATGLAKRSGPNLSEIGKRAYPGWLDAWLADPKALRPHTAMPQLFDATDTGQAERYAVLAYLTSLGGPLPEFKPPTVNANEVRQSIDRGSRLYVIAGCAACHGEQLTAPPTRKKKGEDEDDTPFQPADSIYGIGTATGPQGYYTLGGIGSKTRPEALAKFLANPLATNPHGRMPSMNLTDREALDIARHMCRVTDDKLKTDMPAAPNFDPAKLLPAGVRVDGEASWSRVGEVLFTSKGCIQCHEVKKGVLPVSTVKPLADVRKNTAAGCLAEKPSPGQVANYALTADQRAALASFLKDGLSGAGSASPVHSARIALKRFNCLNCHLRDGEGGIDSALADKMKSLETADNADDVQPPRLGGVGHKMRTSWMKDVLLGAGRARPWMNLRMPQYGPDNVGHLPDSLPLLEGTVTDDEIGKAEFTKEKVTAGRTLAGKSGHGCISCHDISGLKGGGTRGPDLATTNKRVRYDWYTRWMHQPQRMAPGTKMPQAFINGKSLLTEVFDGDGDKQVEALWAYFALGPGLPLPAGIEPPKGVTVFAKDRPEVLRTFMPDNAGTKCIAVGFPGGANTVFDSSQCRLAYAWSGNFLDVSPVWNDRGGNPAKLLGPKFWTAPVGQPWALEDESSLPDFVKQSTDPAYAAPLSEGKVYTGPMAVKFKGYALNDGGVPTFSYVIAPSSLGVELKVSETPQPVVATVANGLARKFAVDVPAGKTAYFLAGVTEAGKLPRLLNVDNQSVKLPEVWETTGVKVILPQGGDSVSVLNAATAAADAKWRFVTAGERTQAILELPGGKAGLKTDVTVNIWSLPKDEPALLKELK